MSPLNVEVRRRTRPLNVAIFDLHLIHVEFAVTLGALGHAVLGARTSLCKQAKRCSPTVHSRTSSRPLKRPCQDDKKQQGGGKWQQDSGEKLQQDSGDELQQEGGEELQQEAGDVGLKITLFEGAHTTCLFGSALVLGMRCLESGRAPRRIEREHLYAAHSPDLGWSRQLRILVENMSKRSDRAQVMEIQGNLLEQNMSPRQFCNEILPELFAEVIDQAELPVRGASWLPEVRKAARRLKQQHLDKIAAR